MQDALSAQARRLAVSALVLCGLTAAGAPGAASAGTGGGVPFLVEYQGTYTWHQDVRRAGAESLVANETLQWDWRGKGGVPEVANLAPLSSTLAESGTIDQQQPSGGGPSEHCTLSPGANASEPLRLSTTGYGLMVGYNYAIPSTGLTSTGDRQGCGVFSGDALMCGRNSCATFCPGSPTATSSQRYVPAIAGAFAPTTASANNSYANLADGNGSFWGTNSRRFDLPPASGVFQASCNGNYTENDTLSISSSVTITLINDAGPLSIYFPDGDFPPLVPPIDLLFYPPVRSGVPTIAIPPTIPQPSAAPQPAPPVVGGIVIRCPKRLGRCTGTITITPTRSSRQVLGTGRFSLKGGTDEFTDVHLSRGAGALLQQAGSLPVSVRITTLVQSTHRRFAASRTVRLMRASTA